MSIPFLNHIDLGKNEIRNMRVQNLASAPSSPAIGQIYFHNTSSPNVKEFRVWDGSEWIPCNAPLYEHPDLQHIPEGGSSLNLLVWDSNGTAKWAAMTDDLHGSRGGGTRHAAATITVAGFMSAADKVKLDAATSSANNNTIILRDGSGRARVSNPSHSSDIANKSYVDAAVGGVIGAADAMVYKGAINASTNPNYPAADAGHTYKISHAGKIGGASGEKVEVGDMIICLSNGTAAGTQAAVGSDWNVIQANVDGAVTNGNTGPVASGNFPMYDGTSGNVISDSSYSPSSFASNSHNNTQHSTNYAPEARTLTINGSEQSLAGDRTWSVGTITQIVAGSGMVGTTVTAGSATINMGTPGTVNGSSTNTATTSSHTHALAVNWDDVDDKPESFAPSGHEHGNITDAGAIGTAASRVVTTGTGGVLQASTQNSAFNRSFGTGNTNVARGDHDHNGHHTRKATKISSGGATEIVAHNLGTRHVIVQIFNSTTYKQVMAEVVHTDNNTVTINFAATHPAGTYEIVVIG